MNKYFPLLLCFVLSCFITVSFSLDKKSKDSNKKNDEQIKSEEVNDTDNESDTSDKISEKKKNNKKAKTEEDDVKKDSIEDDSDTRLDKFEDADEVVDKMTKNKKEDSEEASDKDDEEASEEQETEDETLTPFSSYYFPFNDNVSSISKLNKEQLSKCLKTKCVKVYSGDLIQVEYLDENGETVKKDVRLIGIKALNYGKSDTSEQSYGKFSKEYLTRKLIAKKGSEKKIFTYLAFDKMTYDDVNKRLLAYVFIKNKKQGQCINTLMVYKGYVLAYTKLFSNYINEFLILENMAIIGTKSSGAKGFWKTYKKLLAEKIENTDSTLKQLVIARLAQEEKERKTYKAPVPLNKDYKTYNAEGFAEEFDLFGMMNQESEAQQCLGMSKDGKACRSKTTNRNGYCEAHQNQYYSDK